MHDEADTPIAPEYQDTGYPLPPYRELFGLYTWLANAYMEWPWDCSDFPDQLRDALPVVERLIDCALGREGMLFDDMLRAVQAGEFD